jgi:molecular chaperone GrpE (heat shock protein)
MEHTSSSYSSLAMPVRHALYLLIYGEMMPERDRLSVDSNREASAVNRRFRLPKLFAESDAAAPLGADSEIDLHLPPLTGKADSADASEYAAATHPDTAGNSAAESLIPPDTTANAARAAELSATSAHSNGDSTASPVPPQPAYGTALNGGVGNVAARGSAIVLQEMQQMRAEMEDVSRTLHELNQRGLAQDKVFNVLHKELQEYKNDFIYERLKPMVRPLLFLFDSLEQFDAELTQYDRNESQPADEVEPGMAWGTVRRNISFFRDQLVEALRICEVTPMEKREGHFDPRLHKAIDTVQVAPDQDNVVQRVVRSGWYLNGHVFRLAEVVVGKKVEDYDAKLWNYGKSS